MFAFGWQEFLCFEFKVFCTCLFAAYLDLTVFSVNLCNFQIMAIVTVALVHAFDNNLCI